ncbi:hypothetical protein LENED_008483 [Lentinula edodes]|uniref:Uncharacterized protein n=1 Tax=Lentinula edodes TaxID=5353 RepID=A0A1Q3EHB8_LENED|nr:hypothetical protein LENED_008483 [Lentinula edodes]
MLKVAYDFQSSQLVPSHFFQSLHMPGAALTRKNPLVAINPDFVKLGSILETQNACFTMQDLMQVNRVIRDACSSRSLKCLGSLDVELAMDALNALHKASTSNTHNLANSLRRLVESSPPPDSATKALEGLKEVEKGSADEGTSSQVGGSVLMELDLPTIESLAE